MTEVDYDPVEAPEDEEERKRREGGYPAPAPNVITRPPAMPEASPVTVPINAKPLPAYPAPAPAAPALGPQRPKWSDYVPPESHGWGKFGHIMAALNPATNMVFNQLPQERAQAAYRHATEEYEAPGKEAAQEATTEHTKAATEALENPPPPKEPNLETNPKALTLHYLLTGDNGKPIVNPDTGKPYNTIEAFKKVNETEQEAKPERQAQAPHVTYDSGIPVSVTAGGKVYDVNDPKMPPELKPLVDAANRAHGQHVKETAEQQARAFANQGAMFDKRQNAMTSTTKSMVEASPKVVSLIDRVSQEIDAQEKNLGPAGSRWSEFMAGKVGAPNPEFTKLRTDVGLLTTLLMRMHVGARGGEAIMEHFKELIDTSKQSPENLRAALSEIKEYANDVRREGESKGVHTGMNEEPKPASGPNLAAQNSGKTLTMGQINQAAKDHGVTPEEAKRQAVAAGYKVQ